MNNINIHQICKENVDIYVPDIVYIFRDDEMGPWHKYEECLAWVRHKAERGFYIQAVYDGDKIVGYSEWIETYDEGVKILYLCIMQVDCDFRGRGIGTLMIDDGELYAKKIGAAFLRTIPEDDKSHRFYLKNNFIDTETIYRYVLDAINEPTPAHCAAPVNLTMDIINSHEFIFGLVQSSGRYVYECMTYTNEYDRYAVKTAIHPKGHLQFWHRQNAKSAYVVYWSKEAVDDDIILSILKIGHNQGFDKIEFCFKSKYRHLFIGYEMEDASTQLEKDLS